MRRNGVRGGACYRRLVEESPEVAVILGPGLIVRYASPAAGRVLGLDPSGLVGDDLSLYLHPDDAAWARDTLPVALDRGSEIPSREVRVRHADGSWRWFEAAAVDLLDDPRVEGVAIYLHDVTGGRRVRDQLAHRAFHDPLTGLANRTLFEDRLGHALARAKRNREPVVVLFVDLDDFKAVNDCFGHKVGDELLVAVGRRLEGALRPCDTVARLGGDEFAVLLEDGGGPAGATRTAKRLLRALREPVALGEPTLSITSSIGGAVGEPGSRGEELIQQADAAMYRAKRTGKDRFKLFDGSGAEDLRGRIRFEHHLERALERDEIGVHFQPEVDLGSGRIVGMEALLRWEYPWYELASPREVVALAETGGLMDAVGRQVLEKACRQGSLWQRRYPKAPPLVSVNVSAKQLRHPGLVDDVSSALENSGLDPANLALEADEGFSPESTPQVALTVEQIRALGVRLVVDDFGQGGSSLASLDRFPIDLLKIGRSFVGRLGRDDENVARLVRAMIGFARTMDIRTVAAGVETREQTASLHEMGCEQAQGFYFFEPTPAASATRLLDNDRGLLR